MRNLLEKALDRLFGGHVSAGPVTVFGRCAMHWAVNIRTERFGYVCFRLPLRCFGRWWPLYFYCSPNATPWAATVYVGNRRRCLTAQERCKAFGHNFRVTDNYDALRAINDAESL